MTTHSSILARRIPWNEEPGRLLGAAKIRTPPSYFHFLSRHDCLSVDMRLQHQMKFSSLTVTKQFPQLCKVLLS